MTKIKPQNAVTYKKDLIERTIYYYELRIEDDTLLDAHEKYTHGLTSLEVLSDILIEFIKPENLSRYFTYNDRHYLVRNIKIDSAKGRVQGEMLLIRKDNFPDIYNMVSDKVKPISTDEEEGVSEKTHFIIEHRKGRFPILAIEHNQFGAKFTDLCQYLTRVGITHCVVKSIEAIPIVKNTLSSTKKRIGKVMKISVRLHNDNLYKVKNLNSGFYTALKATEKCFKNDYSEMVISYDYKNSFNTGEGEGLVKNAISFFIKQKENFYVFDKFTVKAEDSQKGNKYQDFDLLMDRIYSSIKVLRKQREKSIVSDDMFEKMNTELTTLQL